MFLYLISKRGGGIMRCKAVLLSCLLLAFAFALPVQGQATTPTPTRPARLVNPTSMAACGLPASWAEFDTSATVTTFNMTADCVFSDGAVNDNNAFLSFRAGEYTINGNGYSIIGPTNARTIYIIQFTAPATILNLNNVTFRSAGFDNGANIIVYGGRLNGQDLIFRDNTGNKVLEAVSGGEVYLENAQFLDNSGTATRPSVIAVGPAGSATITDAVFSGNAGYEALINSQGPVQLQGFLTLAGNSVTHDSPWLTTGDGVIDIAPPPRPASASDDDAAEANRRGKMSTPTPTPRPQIAATHVALQARTGMTFRPTYGLASGVHFRQLDGAGLGVQSLIDAGFIDAVDVYGYVEQGVEVCFPQVGRVIFLDASASPRAIISLDSTVVNGQTCVSINSPGSLVLLPE